MDKSQQIWHGDLLFVPVRSIPKKAKKKDTRIVAMGESTNHAHRFDGGQVCIYEEEPSIYSRIPESTIYVEIIDPAALVHVDIRTNEKADHDPAEFPIGLFQMIRQTEDDPFTKQLRVVLD